MGRQVAETFSRPPADSLVISGALDSGLAGVHDRDRAMGCEPKGWSMFDGSHRHGRAAAYLLGAAVLLAAMQLVTVRTVRADDVVGAWRGTWTQDGYIIEYGQGNLTITSVEGGVVSGEGSAIGLDCSSPYSYAGTLGGGEIRLSGTAGGGCPEVKLSLEFDGESKLTGRFKVIGGKGGVVNLKHGE